MDNRLDEIAQDMVRLFGKDGVPVMVTFCRGKVEGGIDVGVRYSASVPDQVYMIAAQVTQLAKDISSSMNIDEAGAVEITLESIKDYMLTGGVIRGKEEK